MKPWQSDELTLLDLGELDSVAGHCTIGLSRTAGADLVTRQYQNRGWDLGNMPDAPDDAPLVGLVVRIDEQIRGTMTLAFDNGQLPSEAEYPEHISALRDRGARLCEVGRFAIDPGVRSRHVLGALFHAAWLVAVKLRATTDVIAEVVPHHAAFYRRMLDFEQLGEQRICGRINRPVVLLRADAARVSRSIERASRQMEGGLGFYGYSLPEETEHELLHRWQDAVLTGGAPSSALSRLAPRAADSAFAH